MNFLKPSGPNQNFIRLVTPLAVKVAPDKPSISYFLLGEFG